LGVKEAQEFYNLVTFYVRDLLRDVISHTYSTHVKVSDPVNVKISKSKN